MAKRGKKSGGDRRTESTSSHGNRAETKTLSAAATSALKDKHPSAVNVVAQQESKPMMDGVAALVMGNPVKEKKSPPTVSPVDPPASAAPPPPPAATVAAASARPPVVASTPVPEAGASSPTVVQSIEPALIPTPIAAPTVPPVSAEILPPLQPTVARSTEAPSQLPQQLPQQQFDQARVAVNPASSGPNHSHHRATPHAEHRHSSIAHGHHHHWSAPANPANMLFEVAWEVCWQLGGIYTVLRSKAAEMLRQWGDRYCLIGPYNPATAAVEFEEMPTEGVIRKALDALRASGVPCHYGRWLIGGRPRVILLDYRARFPSLDNDKYLLWADHGISTLSGDGEVNEVVAFGFVVTEFFRILSEIAPERTLLAHFHEWMGGVAVPRIAHLRLPVTTVFTTHATLLGRYLASDNPYFYDHLPFVNPDAEAAKYNILPRHQIEKAAAHAASLFTTVSEVTSYEAEKLLGRVPEKILPNGLNIQRFAALHEFQNLHARYKERIHEFVMGHFFPSYTFDLDKTLYFFTSGRYEYRNKGLDVFIEAMSRLNVRLKQMKHPPTIVAFIVTRAPVRNINVGVLQSQMQMEDLRSYCEQMQESMGRALFQAAAAGRMITMGELVTEDSMVRLKRAIHAGRRYAQPNIVTHDLIDDANDPVLRHLRHRQLFNAADDPVKIIFHPEFVTATSPLIGLDYEQFVRGCHMGIFPSYYEPWGYTPMESVALGVPAVTTDLSGFGAYVEHHVPHHEEHGIAVLKRRDRSFDHCTDELVSRLQTFVQMNRRQRIELRNSTERHSEIFDWAHLAHEYHAAHEEALARTGGSRPPGRVEVKVI